MIKSFNLAIGATAKRLSDAYAVGAAGAIDAASDIPYRQLILQAETADIEIGGSSAVSTTVYGMKLPATAPAAPVVLGPFESGPIKLSDLWAISTTATLHILGVPF